MDTSKLIAQFEFELRGRGYRENTIKNYCSCVTLFLAKHKEKDSLKHISEQDIKEFLYSFKEHNTQRGYHSAIKRLFHYVAKQPKKFKYIQYCKKTNRLPIVLSVEEMGKIIHCASNIKHKTILCLMYSTGMRVGEVINLRIQDIDSARMVINIINAKGGKDRQVGLDPTLLQLLRLYWTQYKPQLFLFNGQNDPQYSERSIAQFLQKYTDLAGIKKRVYPHLIRHCYATHLHEGGIDLSIIQKLLGHGNIKTTEIYSHISHNHISKIITPLQGILSTNSYLKQLRP
jgi:site-specific recombinase XerD